MGAHLFWDSEVSPFITTSSPVIVEVDRRPFPIHLTTTILNITHLWYLNTVLAPPRSVRFSYSFYYGLSVLHVSSLQELGLKKYAVKWKSEFIRTTTLGDGFW